MKKFFKKITDKLAGSGSTGTPKQAADTAPAQAPKQADGDVWKPGDAGSKPAQDSQKPRRRRSNNRDKKPREGQSDSRSKSENGPDKGKEGQGRRQGGQERSGGNRQSKSNSGGGDRRRSGSSGGKQSGDRDRARSDQPVDHDRAKRNRESDETKRLDAIKAHESWDPATFVVKEEEGKKRFHDFALSSEIMHAVSDLGFEYCTPVQADSIGVALDGRDVAGQAQTGTGKTAAFLVTILMRLRDNVPEKRANGTPRALIIAPTRELCLQIEKDAIALSKYCPNRVLAVFGGADFSGQMNTLRENVIDIVCATPGRLLQFRREGIIDLRKVEIMVVDEADRMLDMGFMPDVRAIFNSLPKKEERQTMLYSATLDKTVMNLAAMWMTDPAKVDIEPEMVTIDTVNQLVYTVLAKDKVALVYNLIKTEKMDRVLVFVNRRVNCDTVYRTLTSRGVKCDVLSGAVAQNKRTRLLEEFRNGTMPVLIATDVAGRGLHIDGLDYVINYDIPYAAEEYVHRIGRTGRAGKTGTSITLACEEESFTLMDIEEYIGRALNCTHPDEALLVLPAATQAMPKAKPREARSGGGGRSGGGRSSGGRR